MSVDFIRECPVSRIFITGFSDGLGLAAARNLMADGHDVVLHARSPQRASAVLDLTAHGAAIVIGDLDLPVAVTVPSATPTTITRFPCAM